MTKNDSSTIEEKITQLEQLVSWFEGDDFVLDQAMPQYQKAQKLADEIQQDIAQFKHTVEQVGPADT